MVLVTCESCQKTNGRGEVGTHWICEDCKEDLLKNQTDTDENSEKRRNLDAANS